jgi:hypothetical protein
MIEKAPKNFKNQPRPFFRPRSIHTGQQKTKSSTRDRPFIPHVSPLDGDFVIGPCRLQQPGTMAGNRQQ